MRRKRDAGNQCQTNRGTPTGAGPPATGNQRQTNRGTPAGAGFPALSMTKTRSTGAIGRKKRRAIRFLRKSGFVVVRKAVVWLNLIEPHLCPPVKSKREWRGVNGPLYRSLNFEKCVQERGGEEFNGGERT